MPDVFSLGPVRTAMRADEDALFSLLVELHAHNDLGWGFGWNELMVRTRIEEGTRPDLETRTHPNDQRRGIVGVVDGPDGKLVATIGLFIERPFWFSEAFCPMETWFYVTPQHRRRGLEEALRDYAKAVHERLRPKDYPHPFPLMTGFVHYGPHFGGMLRLWAKLWGSVRQVGALFVTD